MSLLSFRWFRHGPAVVLMALLVLAVQLVSPVHAAASKKKPAADKTHVHQPGKPSITEAPSHETAAARIKRLQRECKGRPNAGMCLGHTR